MTLNLGKLQNDAAKALFPFEAESWTQQLWLGNDEQHCVRAGEIIVGYLLFGLWDEEEYKCTDRKTLH